MLASVGQPSLHGYDACMVYWVQGASQRNCRQKQGETSFAPLWVFLFSRNSREAVTDGQLALTEQLFDAALGWGLQRRAHQNSLPGKRDFGWALG